MTRNMWLTLVFAAVSLAVFIDSMNYGFIYSQMEVFYSPDDRFITPGTATAMVSVLAVMGMANSVFVFLYFLDKEDERKGRENPLVIEISNNTAMGRWGSEKDVIIGAPFSANHTLVANIDLLVKAIDQIILTYVKKKGSKAAAFIAIKPKMEDDRPLTQSDEWLLNEVLKSSSARSGAIFKV